MADWQTRLKRFVRFRDEIPEPFGDLFSVQPPSRQPWPDDLPRCPALEEFYTICGGGQFDRYEVSTISQMGADTRSNRDDVAAAGDEEGLVAERLLCFGYESEVGIDLIWDAVGDRVGLCSPDYGLALDIDDRAGFPLIGRSMADFLKALFTPEGLFAPNRRRLASYEQDWSQVLAWLDQLPDPAP